MSFTFTLLEEDSIIAVPQKNKSKGQKGRDLRFFAVTYTEGGEPYLVDVNPLSSKITLNS